MKKIVALVLSLVMVLGLATTAFGAITLWAPNGSTAECDIYDGEYNTKVNDTDVPVDVTFVPAKALVMNKDGSVKTPGNIAYYTIDDVLFVKVASIPADADASQYIFVKAHDPEVEQGYEVQLSQTANNPYTILKAVDAVTYYGEAAAFSAWSDDCEKYADPEVVDADGKAWPFYTVTKGDVTAYMGFVAKVPAAADTVEDDEMNVLVGGEVVTLDADADLWVFATAHTWMASKWIEATGVVTEYTCTNCKTVGAVINASINAPVGAKIDKLADGTLVAYKMGTTAAAGDKVESAETFDAGIAMYVGMSVMAAAGSAVVLKKKD